MKYFFFALILFGILVSNPANAQEVISSYTMAYFAETDQAEHTVSATKENNFYISMYSFDGKHKAVTLIVDEKDNSKFIDAINEAISTFAEWDSVAKANDVTDLNKEMKTSYKGKAAFLSGNKWQFDQVVSLSFVFKHIDGKAALLIRTGELTSGSNQYIDCDGGAFVFTSAQEAQDFINQISTSAVQKHFSKKDEKDSLFQD